MDNQEVGRSEEELILREYQREACAAIREQWKTNASTILILPTGVGKTVVFSHVIRQIFPKRVLVLANRRELIQQAYDKVSKITGFRCDIEMASQKVDLHGLMGKPQVIISSVQTQCSGGDGSGRMSKFDPMMFGALVIDECHGSTSAQYRRLVAYYRQNPNLKILGVTATPDRSDEESLGQIFETVAYDYEILSAIHDGWLVPVKQQVVTLGSLDISQVKTTGGDLNGPQLAKVMEGEENLQGVASSTLDIAGSKRTLVFTASVDQAERLSEIFNRHKPGIAQWVCGKTPTETRKRILQDFYDGTTQIMCNCSVLCLDSQTEILTSSGWVGMDDMTYEHKVANWNNGTVWFEHPKNIIRRDRKPEEKMIVLETKNRSIRVTGDHRMIQRTMQTKTWKKMAAVDMVGRMCELPISGNAESFDYVMPEISKPKLSLKRRVQANSYTYRKHHGMTKEQAEATAILRIAQRDTLSYTTPRELSLDACELIGFWIGDGSKQKLRTGGVEYTMTQWSVCNNIINRIDNLLSSCGFDYLKKEKATDTGSLVTQWHLSRGTGFGEQQRKGLFRIEPYLDKTGSDLLWSLSETQFHRFLVGYWMADGCDHRDDVNPRKPNIRICGARKPLFDKLQAIACVRGYRTSLTQSDNRGFPIWTFSLTKKEVHIATKYTMQEEQGWIPEKVWCVTSTSGNIITRRRGTVTVTGNCEGYDNPSVEVCVMAKLTKSRSRYAQMIGRSLRPLECIAHELNDCPDAESRRAMIAASSKQFATILDFAGNAGRHRLMSTADILGGKVSDEAIAAAKARAKSEGKPVDMSAMLEEEEEKKRQAEAKRIKLIARAKYAMRNVDPFDVLQLEMQPDNGWNQNRVLSDKQRGTLERQGIDPDTLTYTQGSQLISEIFRRYKEGLCSYKMSRLLRKRGYDGNVSKEEAGRIIEMIKMREGWKQ